MSKRIDMTNETYGWLRVLGPSDIRTKSGEMKWKCQCRCGNITYVTRNNLKTAALLLVVAFTKNNQLIDKKKDIKILMIYQENLERGILQKEKNFGLTLRITIKLKIELGALITMVI